MRNFVKERAFRRNQILRTIGTLGWEPISRFVFASCLTGTPVMVMGTHGAGKTMTFRRMATKCFGLDYALYDASKANLVDLIGYPNVEKFKDGVMDFIHTPMSIWGKKILILDEATRARDDIQNNYLELLRNGTIQGIDTGVVFKFLAANSLEYQGTRTLDEAFASRIGYVCEVPEFLDMEDDDQLAVLESKESSDSPGLRIWNTNLQDPDDLVPDQTQEFSEFMSELSELFEEVKKTYNDMFAEYVIKFGNSLLQRTSKEKSFTVKVDARTAGTLVDNILANVTLDLYEFRKLGEDFTSEVLREVVLDCVSHCFPWELTGVKVPKTAIGEAHNLAYTILETRDLVAYTITTERDPVRKVMLSLVMEDLEPMALYDSIEEILEDEKSKEAIMFSMLFMNHPEFVEKLKDKKEYLDRIEEIRNTVHRYSLDYDVPENLQKVIRDNFSEEQTRCHDGEHNHILDNNMRHALLYLNAHHERQLEKLDETDFLTQLQEMVEYTSQVYKNLDGDYESIKENLLSMRMA